MTKDLASNLLFVFVVIVVGMASIIGSHYVARESALREVKDQVDYPWYRYEPEIRMLIQDNKSRVDRIEVMIDLNDKLRKVDELSKKLDLMIPSEIPRG